MHKSKYKSINIILIQTQTTSDEMEFMHVINTQHCPLDFTKMF